MEISKKEKKVAVKKAVAKVVEKKAPVAKKAVAEKKVVVKKSAVQLVSFSVTAIIPTQQYGNIQPTITVTAPSIEEAREVVMPALESIYLDYAESVPRGKAFFVAPKITEETRIIEKAVTPSEVGAPNPMRAPAPTQAVVQAAAQPQVPAPDLAPAPAPAPVASVAEKSESFKKAARAISLALGHPALDMIRAQIESSVKIDPSDKPELIASLVNRKNEIPF